jgi:integrase
MQFELFGTWLATVAKRGNAPFKATSFQQYMRHIVRLIEMDFPPPLVNVARSPRSKRFIKAVARNLDSTKQRARPVRISDLLVLAQRLPHFYAPVLEKLVRAVALIAFWGCLRLGTILQEPTSSLEVLKWRDFVFDGSRLYVSIFRDKTVKKVDDCHQIVLDPILSNPLLCPVRAFLEYSAICPHVSADDPFSRFALDSPALSFDAFLSIFNAVVPSISATASVKGHFTGHSFRRGHAQAAIEHGIEVDDLMLFGNWKTLPSVRNYTAGAVKASRLSSVIFT